MVILLACLCLLNLFTDADGDDRPNFVIFVADDMAWDDCGAYGHPTIRTPVIDRLAREGLRFDSAFLTASSCSPSRSSMLTSRYPHATGAAELHQPLPAEQLLATTPLRAVGYFTAAAGKWHLGEPAKRQFDLVREGGGPGGEEHWVKVLQERPRNQPFFCWFAAFDPHRDYQPGAIADPHQAAGVRVPPFLPDTPAVREDLAMYYDEVSRFDSGIGAVVKELEAQKVLDQTMLLVISDNGRPFPRCKTRVNVDGIKTPFIVRYPPWIPPGQSTGALVSSIDIAPTVLEMAGIQRPDRFQGVSLVPVLKDPRTEVRELAFAEHNWHDYRAFERAVVSKEHLLIHNWLPDLPATPPADAVRSPTYREMQRMRGLGELTALQSDVFAVPRPTVEMYAWTEDTNCLTNLADVEQQAAVKQRLLMELAAWQQWTQDCVPDAESLTADRFDRTSGLRLDD